MFRKNLLLRRRTPLDSPRGKTPTTGEPRLGTLERYHNHPVHYTVQASNQLTRRSFTLGLAFASLSAQAQTYPNRSIEWVVPYPPGGGTDALARLLADAMGRSLGQTILISNKAGAATNIGADYVAHAKPDGYTIMSADTATLATNPHLYSKLNYSADRDLAPVGLSARFPLILAVNPSVPAINLKTFLAWAKSHPGANFASPGAGSPHHLTAELFALKTGTKFTHVPYRGAAPAVVDVVGGQVPFMFVDTAAGYSFISKGKLKALGIASPKRVTNFEDIPTLDEQGLSGFEAYAWQGLMVPTGTPAAVIGRLNEALLAALNSTEIKARLQVLGLEATPSSADQMAKYIKTERSKWGAVIKASGVKIE